MSKRRAFLVGWLASWAVGVPLFLLAWYVWSVVSGRPWSWGHGETGFTGLAVSTGWGYITTFPTSLVFGGALGRTIQHWIDLDRRMREIFLLVSCLGGVLGVLSAVQFCWFIGAKFPLGLGGAAGVGCGLVVAELVGRSASSLDFHGGELG